MIRILHRSGLHVETFEPDAFLGAGYLVTHHDQPDEAVGHVWTSCQRHRRHLEKAVDHVPDRLVDGLAASYMSVIERFDDAIDHVEDEVFDRPTPATLQRIFLLERSLPQLCRTLLPQREVLDRLARGDYAVIDFEDRSSSATCTITSCACTTSPRACVTWSAAPSTRTSR